MSFYTFARGLVKIYYKFMFRMDIQGEEHIPTEGGVVLCCNHMSNFDPTTMAAFVKRPVRYIAKKELFEKGVNDSLVHVDFMMGTEDLMIDGILEDGSHVKIFENGNFVF